MPHRRDQGWADQALQHTAYTYDKADRITSAGGVTYTVNATGNLTSRVGGSVNDSFTHDQANRLTVSSIGGAPTITASYAYNGDGLRVSKTVGATTTSYVYDLVARLPVLLGDGTRKYVCGATGLAYNVTTASGALEVYHKDHLGSIRELTTTDQSVTTIFLTDEYGVPTTKQGPCGTSTCASTQPFWFTGELQDTDTGTNFVYLRARYYSPGEGRFISRDGYSVRTDAPDTPNRAANTATIPQPLSILQARRSRLRFPSLLPNVCYSESPVPVHPRRPTVGRAGMRAHRQPRRTGIRRRSAEHARGARPTLVTGHPAAAGEWTTSACLVQRRPRVISVTLMLKVAGGISMSSTPAKMDL